MLRGQVSAGRHAESGEQEDGQGPPARPVDHGAVVVARHWGKSRDMVGHAEVVRRAGPRRQDVPWLRDTHCGSR